ncbi:MAG: putative fatty acid desaturase [Frankiales bacterium]|nr:putative fatty acid desaturase [Frankiales bacterium]
MAVTDIKAFAHLSEADVTALGEELDAIRREIEQSRGERDAAYIKKAITIQRSLAAGGRITLFASAFPPAWVAGTTMLGLAKIIENMELGHNVIHGQWDWMNDPEIHSSTWEWDTTCPSEQWKHSHNFVHHKYTNVVGRDDDVGYGILRVTRDQKWHPIYLGQPVYNAMLALFFQYAVALHDLNIGEIRRGKKDKRTTLRQLKQIGRKVGRQLGKDYVLFPLLTGPQFVSTLTANAAANLMRNLWSYTVIFCGHFPDGAEKFTVEQFENETPHEWYLRQMLGSANFKAGPLMAFMSGNLCYQIEHHLFPDLPSNRYAEMSVRIRALCEKYELPYTTGTLAHQYFQTLRTIWKLTLPNRFLTATSDAAPETASERGGSVQEIRGLRMPERLAS